MYTVEERNKLLELYTNTNNIDEIAKILGKTPRSVRSKLVQEKVYKPISKSLKIESKKDILKEISSITGEDLYGLLPASKETLLVLLEILKNKF